MERASGCTCLWLSYHTASTAEQHGPVLCWKSEWVLSCQSTVKGPGPQHELMAFSHLSGLVLLCCHWYYKHYIIMMCKGSSESSWRVCIMLKQYVDFKIYWHSSKLIISFFQNFGLQNDKWYNYFWHGENNLVFLAWTKKVFLFFFNEMGSYKWGIPEKTPCHLTVSFAWM